MKSAKQSDFENLIKEDVLSAHGANVCCCTSLVPICCAPTYISPAGSIKYSTVYTGNAYVTVPVGGVYDIVCAGLWLLFKSPTGIYAQYLPDTLGTAIPLNFMPENISVGGKYLVITGEGLYTVFYYNNVIKSGSVSDLQGDNIGHKGIIVRPQSKQYVGMKLRGLGWQWCFIGDSIYWEGGYVGEIDYTMPDVRNAQGQSFNNLTYIPYPGLPTNGKVANFMWVKNGFLIAAPPYVSNRSYNYNDSTTGSTPYWTAFKLFTYFDGNLTVQTLGPYQCWGADRSYGSSNVGSVSCFTSTSESVGLIQSTFIHERSGGFAPRIRYNTQSNYAGMYNADAVTALIQTGTSVNMRCDIRGGTYLTGSTASTTTGHNVSVSADEEDGIWGGSVSTVSGLNEYYIWEYGGWANDWMQMSFQSQKDSIETSHDSYSGTPQVILFGNSNILQRSICNTLNWHNSNSELIEMQAGPYTGSPRFYNETHSNYQTYSLPGGLSVLVTDFYNGPIESRCQMFKHAGFIFAQFLVAAPGMYQYGRDIWCTVDPDTLAYTQYTDLNNRTPRVQYARLTKCLPGGYGVYLTDVGTFAYDGNVFFTPRVRYDLPAAPDTVQKYRDGVGCGLFFGMTYNLQTVQPDSNILSVSYCCFDESGIMTETSASNRIDRTLGVNPTYRSNVGGWCYGSLTQQQNSANCNIALNGWGGILANPCNYSNGNPVTGTITNGGMWCYVWKGTWLSDNHQNIIGEKTGAAWFSEMAFIYGRTTTSPVVQLFHGTEVIDIGEFQGSVVATLGASVATIKGKEFITGEEQDFTSYTNYASNYGFEPVWGSFGTKIYDPDWNELYSDATPASISGFQQSQNRYLNFVIANSKMLLMKPGNGQFSSEVMRVEDYDTTEGMVFTTAMFHGMYTGSKLVLSLCDFLYNFIDIDVQFSTGTSISQTTLSRHYVVYESSQGTKAVFIWKDGTYDIGEPADGGTTFALGHNNPASDYLAFRFNSNETAYRIVYRGQILKDEDGNPLVITTNLNVGSSGQLFYSANDTLLIIDGAVTEPVYPITNATTNFKGNYIIYQHDEVYDLYYKSTPVIEGATSMSVPLFAEDYCGVTCTIDGNQVYRSYFKGEEQGTNEQTTNLSLYDTFSIPCFYRLTRNNVQYIYSIEGGEVASSLTSNIPSSISYYYSPGVGIFLCPFFVFRNFELEWVCPAGMTPSLYMNTSYVGIGGDYADGGLYPMGTFAYHKDNGMIFFPSLTATSTNVDGGNFTPTAEGQAGYLWGKTSSSSPVLFYRNAVLMLTTTATTQSTASTRIKCFLAQDTVLYNANASGVPDWQYWYAGELQSVTLPAQANMTFTLAGNYIIIRNSQNVYIGYLFKGQYVPSTMISANVTAASNQICLVQPGIPTNTYQTALFYRDNDLTDQLPDYFQTGNFNTNTYSELIVFQSDSHCQVWYGGETVQDETTIGLPTFWNTACHQWQDDSNAYVVCGTTQTIDDVTTWISFFILNPDGTIFKQKSDIEGQPVAGTENFTGTIDWIRECELTKYNDDGTLWKNEWKYYHGNPINDANPVLIVHTDTGHFCILNEFGEWYESRNDNFASNFFTCCGDKIATEPRAVYSVKGGFNIG